MGVVLAENERAGEAGAPDGDSELITRWRAWTAVIEQPAFRRTQRRIQPDGYRSLHGELIRACRSRVETADEVKRPFYERLVALAQPWLTSRLLEQSDREILFDLLICCREAELELNGLPQAARDLRGQIATHRQSANRPMSSAAQLWLALGMCLGMLVILAALLMAIW